MQKVLFLCDCINNNTWVSTLLKLKTPERPRSPSLLPAKGDGRNKELRKVDSTSICLMLRDPY